MALVEDLEFWHDVGLGFWAGLDEDAREMHGRDVESEWSLSQCHCLCESL
jgi:hypothetical protein